MAVFGKGTWRQVWNGMYEVNKKGQVRNSETKKLMKIDASGCVYLSDYGTRFHPSVKALVKQAF